jgi:hypothetical protein
MNVAFPLFQGQQAAVAKYELTDFDGSASTRLVDGTKMQMNDDGRVIQIQYASGATVRRHSDYVMVRSNNSSYWFGDCSGRWFPLD